MTDNSKKPVPNEKGLEKHSHTDKGEVTAPILKPADNKLAERDKLVSATRKTSS